MKKILLATSNKDKFKIVKYILDKAGLSENDYEFLSLKDINYSGPDEKEQGTIKERARAKATSVSKSIYLNGHIIPVSRFMHKNSI